MFHKIKDFFKTRSEYHRSMIELSAAVTDKLNQLMDAELARTRAELKALEAVKEINSAFAPEEMVHYMEQISEFLTEFKQPSFQESFYQSILDSAHKNDATFQDSMAS